jgi:hypothetical protein
MDSTGCRPNSPCKALGFIPCKSAFSNHVGVTTIERPDQGHLYPLGEPCDTCHSRGANLRHPAPQARALPKELSRQLIAIRNFYLGHNGRPPQHIIFYHKSLNKQTFLTFFWSATTKRDVKKLTLALNWPKTNDHIKKCKIRLDHSKFSVFFSCSPLLFNGKASLLYDLRIFDHKRDLEKKVKNLLNHLLPWPIVGDLRGCLEGSLILQYYVLLFKATSITLFISCALQRLFHIVYTLFFIINF